MKSKILRVIKFVGVVGLGLIGLSAISVMAFLIAAPVLLVTGLIFDFDVGTLIYKTVSYPLGILCGTYEVIRSGGLIIIILAVVISVIIYPFKKLFYLLKSKLDKKKK